MVHPRRQARSSMARETLQGERRSCPSQSSRGQEQDKAIGGRLYGYVGSASVPAP
jgi:hypothetical protein